MINIESYDYACETQSVSSLVNDIDVEINNRINLTPIYQRDVVWDDEDKASYIISVIKGVAGNNITFVINNLTGIKTCIDGKQRSISLLNYSRNKFCIEINDKKYFYGPTKDKINMQDLRKEDKDNIDKIDVLDNEMRAKFNNRKINIVEYRDLDYNQQVEIFNRIQHGKKLTHGEMILSKIENIKSCEQMKEYCEKNQEPLKLYYKNRKDHYNFIVQMMYLFSKNISPLITKEIDKFLNKLQPVDIIKLTTLVSLVINKLFNNKIFNTAKIISLQLCRVEIPLLCLKIYEKIITENVNLSNDDNNKIIDIITKTHNKVKELKKIPTKQILIKIAEIFDEVYEQVYETNTENEDSEDIDEDSEDIDIENEEIIEEIIEEIKPVKQLIDKNGKTINYIAKSAIKPVPKKVIIVKKQLIKS